MRICLVVHGFPPVERTGVENYTLGLARALARAGHRVEVFVPRRDPQLADLALRREERGGFAVNWITYNRNPESPRDVLLVPGLRSAFAAFLERERPEVVHFQHLIKVGIELVEVARELGLPTVYTAHDYYPICHRYTLLRPDLSRCDARGDSGACSRCDLALAHLNALPGLGDYHAGVLRSQVPAADWEKLQGILAGRPEAHGIPAAAVEAAFETRRGLDEQRERAYRALDLVLAPSRHLIEELVRGGFARERIQHQPYGFDNADLAGLPSVRSDPARAVRFAFLGGLAKHKGVHVLLEAFAELRAGAELAVWGGSSDHAYEELLRRRCSEVGAQWRGPYERSDLPAILAGIDALVVPSIWVENQPLVVHEAFSAGRPVLASRLGALEEHVQDGVNGLLFEPLDPHDLARSMRRCIEEPGLLRRLAAGIGPVKSMEEETRVLAERYQGLAARSRDARAKRELPASLQASLARHEELRDQPSRELLVRVLSGLDDLREAWAEEVGALDAVALLASGLGEGSEAQDRLREARNEIAWLRTKKEELDEGREELMTLFEDLDRLLGDARAGSRHQAEHLESAGAYVRQKEAEVREAHERLRELEGLIERKDRHIQEVEGQLGEVQEDLDQAGRYIRHKEREHREAEAELRKAVEHARAKEAELAAARAGQLVVDEDRRAAEVIRRAAEEGLRAAEEGQRAVDRGARAAAEVGLTALEAQERLLARVLRPILDRLQRTLRPGTEPVLPAEGAHFAELVGVMRQVLAGLETLGAELEWRRGLMADAHRAADKPLIRKLLGRTGVVRMVLEWDDGKAAREEGRR